MTLVLRRFKNQSIIINGDISVTVQAIEGDRVKLGVTAPPEISIVREELLKQNKPVVPTPWLEKDPDIYFVADRNRAKEEASPRVLAYITTLETIVTLTNQLMDAAIDPKVNNFELARLTDGVIDALSTVNFLSPTDELFENEKEPIHV